VYYIQPDILISTAHTGAVTLIQRFGCALNLNIHFDVQRRTNVAGAWMRRSDYMLFLDGVYVGEADSFGRFRGVKKGTQLRSNAAGLDAKGRLFVLYPFLLRFRCKSTVVIRISCQQRLEFQLAPNPQTPIGIDCTIHSCMVSVSLPDRLNPCLEEHQLRDSTGKTGWNIRWKYCQRKDQQD